MTAPRPHSSCHSAKIHTDPLTGKFRCAQCLQVCDPVTKPKGNRAEVNGGGRSKDGQSPWYSSYVGKVKR